MRQFQMSDGDTIDSDEHTVTISISQTSNLLGIICNTVFSHTVRIRFKRIFRFSKVVRINLTG